MQGRIILGKYKDYSWIRCNPPIEADQVLSNSISNEGLLSLLKDVDRDFVLELSFKKGGWKITNLLFLDVDISSEPFIVRKSLLDGFFKQYLQTCGLERSDGEKHEYVILEKALDETKGEYTYLCGKKIDG